MHAWLFQDTKQKQKLGGDKCPWSVGWYDPEGRKRSKRIGSRSLAEKFARKIEGQLAAGTYSSMARKSWGDFQAEYEAKIANGMESGTRTATLQAMAHFERVCKPRRVDTIKTQMIDAYVSTRRTERGRKKRDTVSSATINKELRHLKAILNVAHEWGYLPVTPKVRMMKEIKKLPRYITAEHFAAIYQACDSARMPRSKGMNCPSADWWRALLTMAYMTGWRVGEPLALRRDDLDLDAGTAITRGKDNKGRRDERIPLHPVVVEHLRRIVGFTSKIFPWPHGREVLWSEFCRIQQAAGILSHAMGTTSTRNAVMSTDSTTSGGRSQQ